MTNSRTLLAFFGLLLAFTFLFAMSGTAHALSASVISKPPWVPANSQYTVKWTVSNATNVTRTVVRWGTEPKNFINQETLQSGGSGTYSATLTAPSGFGAIYFIVHTEADGQSLDTRGLAVNFGNSPVPVTVVNPPTTVAANANFEITWTVSGGNSPVAHTNVHWATASHRHPTNFSAAQTGGNGTYKATLQAPPSGKIYFWIHAYADSDATFPFTTATPEHVVTIVSIPSPPTSVAASDGTFNDRIRVSWGAVSGATRYEVYRATSSGGAKTLLSSNLTGTTYDDCASDGGPCTASAGIRYHYFVKACNAAGCGAFSAGNTGFAGQIVTLVGLSISGSNNVDENASKIYAATAEWSDGTLSTVTTSATWSENSAFASIDGNGKLSALPVTSKQTVTVTARYSAGGVTKTATKAVTINDIGKILIGLSINGPTSVNERNSAGYSATARWDDGTSSTVTPTWSENSGFASITNGGLLSTTSVTGNQSVTVGASFTFEDVKKTDSKKVTIVDGDVTLEVKSVSAPPSVAAGSTFQVTWSVSGSTSMRHTNVHWSTETDDAEFLKTTRQTTTGQNRGNGSYTQTMTAPAKGRICFLVHAEDANRINSFSAVQCIDVIGEVELRVSNVDAPLTVRPGQTFQITWTVAGSVSMRHTNVHWSMTTSDLEFLKTTRQTTTGQNRGNGSYTQTMTAPNTEGTIFFLVHAEDAGSVNAFTVVLTIAVEGNVVVNEPVISGVTAPSSVPAGSSYQVSWTVSGSGSMKHTNVHWSTETADREFLKTTRQTTTALNRGNGTYTQRMTAPPTEGVVHILVHAEDAGRINTYTAVRSITVTKGSLPELAVSDIDAPSEVEAGSTFEVSWTVSGSVSMRHTNVHWSTKTDDREFLKTTRQTTTGLNRSNRRYTQKMTASPEGGVIHFLVHAEDAGRVNAFSEMATITVTGGKAVLTGLTIIGPSRVVERGSAQYTATATFSDGSSNAVDPAWSDGSNCCIGNNGLFLARGPQEVRITAIYKLDDITKTANKTVEVYADETGQSLDTGISSLAAVSVIDVPDSVAPDATYEIAWAIAGATSVTKTNVRWGLTAGDQSNASAAQSGVSASYRATLTAPSSPGSIYFHVQAEVDGVTLVSPTQSIRVAAGGAVAYLLLHGHGSDASVWDDLVDDRFGRGNCETMDQSTPTVPETACYRYQFEARTQSGRVWRNGDGSSLQQLGTEVARAVARIESAARPGAIIFVGHGRGGLAARAYIQSLSAAPAFKIGLLSIGTPHLGTPLGRIHYWLERNGYDVEAAALPSSVSALVSPSMGDIASSHDETASLERSPISATISALNDDIGKLADHVSVFGSIVSAGVPIGHLDPTDADPLCVGASADLLDPLPDQSCLDIGIGLSDSGDWVTVRDDTLRNLPSEWIESGDGIVPLYSQQLVNVPGFSQAVLKTVLNSVRHSNETTQTLAIGAMLDAMIAQGGL